MVEQTQGYYVRSHSAFKVVDKAWSTWEVSCNSSCIGRRSLDVDIYLVLESPTVVDESVHPGSVSRASSY